MQCGKSKILLVCAQLTFNFVPKFVLLCADDNLWKATFVSPATSAYSYSLNAFCGGELQVSWSSKSISWYATRRYYPTGGNDNPNAVDQMNDSGQKYFWVAVG